MMRLWNSRLACGLVLGLTVAWGGIAHAQDPTVPSASMEERLELGNAAPKVVAEDSPAVVPAVNKIPALKLRAIVLADADHGTAILMAGDQRIVIRLDRTALSTEQGPNGNLLDGFAVAGVFFRIDDFSNHSLLLRAMPFDVAVVVQ